MTWFVTLESTVAVEDHEADTEAEAIEVARTNIREWLDREPHDVTIGLDWNVGHE
jgi:hypothetical protein